ncbi:hypothetical protein ACBP82_10705 [Paenalcaligenes hominis]|uniref:hypothetical protein n=1 Tax=Paenalcaligenes hominis TaxID=643674 RepID=UPI003525BD37
MNTHQKGQVLVLALLALGVFSTLMLKFFYVGQINYQALRQRYALDAAVIPPFLAVLHRRMSE